jgi:hypothetical protein
MYCIGVFAAARALEASTKLSLSDVEIVQVHADAADRRLGQQRSCRPAQGAQGPRPDGRTFTFAAHLALSEKGFVDEQYKPFFSRMEAAHSVVKLGYSTDQRDVQPMLAEALMVPAREPTDAEIYRHFLLRLG